MKEQQLSRVRNKKVSIIVKGDGIDDDGFPVESQHIEIRKVWSSIRGLRGKEFFSASQVQSQNVKIFNFKYFEGLEEDMFIEFPKGTFYNIESINNLNERNVEYEVHAKEVSPSE